MITETQAERLIAAMERLTESLGRPATCGGELLTILDVAAMLKRSRKYVERLVRKGTLKKVPNQGARTTRFRPVDVERLCAPAEMQAGRRRL